MEKQSAFSDDVKEAADRVGGEWIKASEFEAGLVLQMSKPVERVKSLKYGAVETDWLVKKEILEVGESFRYTFTTPDGDERKIDTKSSPFFIGIRQVEDLGVGDWLRIVRTGQRDETRFIVERVETPEEVTQRPAKAKQPERPKYDSELADNIADSIPF